MKQTALLLITLIVGLNVLIGKTIDVHTAQLVGQNFFNHSANRHETNLSLAYIEKAKDGSPAYFVFNIKQDDGFVIVTGDDAALPVLGYSTIGHYDTNNLPVNFVKWMQGYRQQILYIKTNNLEANNEIQNQWQSIKNNQFSGARGITAVNPLLTTTWNQGAYYNDLCPGGSYTGCVATAMAQVMKYWNHPDQGTGFHSYNENDYGTLSANFGNTTYNWGNMPNSVTNTNTDVATLMYHCGVSVDMDYSPQGSGAQTLDVANALKTYFGYASSVQGVNRSAYGDPQWIGLLKSELDLNRPIQYAGTGTGGGHSFVCDGYDNNDFFHFNWGWGGNSDAYFNIDALNPGSLGIGGGSGGFNSNQRAIIGIEPASVGTTANIEMNSAITITPSSPIDFKESFTVNANIKNGNSIFNGEFCAALFKAFSGDFISYVDIKTGITLSAGASYAGIFSTTGMLTVPGDYTIGIYYKPNGGNWTLAGNTLYPNYTTVTMNSPSNLLEVSLNMDVSPIPFVQGQSASVIANFRNMHNYTYDGQFQAVLYDLNGNLVQTIDTYNENTGVLTAWASYDPPYISFSTSAITASPGTYILAILEKETTASNWSFAGGGFFTNPIYINVAAPDLSTDMYESNNTTATAFNFALNFSANTATQNTSGSNIDNTSDYDFYKIDLASGYDYQITARVHDRHNSGNGNIYTCDVLFSYDAGSGSSDAYDDIMPNNISVNNGGTVTFKVAPYFAGEAGTYLLDLSITRTVSTAINEITNADIKIFPIPAANSIFMEINNSNLKFGKVKIQNHLGQIVKEFTNQNLSMGKIDFNVSDLQNGIYFIQVKDEKQKAINKKIVINR